MQINSEAESGRSGFLQDVGMKYRLPLLPQLGAGTEVSGK